MADDRSHSPVENTRGWPLLPLFGALALFSALATLPFVQSPGARIHEFFFAVEITSDAPGYAKIYLDDGEGLRESLAETVQLAAPGTSKTCLIPIPAGFYHGLRFDPIDSAATLTIGPPRIVAADGSVIREIAPTALRPIFQIDAFEQAGDHVRVTTTPGGIDPQLYLELNPPLHLASKTSGAFAMWIRRSITVFLILSVAALLAGRIQRRNHGMDRLIALARAHPSAACLVLSAGAAIASSYPIVFNGRSYVSPNYADGTILLYDRFPTLPGYSDTTTEHAKGSDMGAMAWSHGPISVLQHEALIDHGELPLWNRYNSTGTALLGQGQIMFGDPLHLLVVVADGAAWAWDAKYVIARFLFAFVLGLIVLAVTAHAPAAWLTAFSAPFIGFFLYRINHPAFFSLCYSPLILYAWIRAVQAANRREMAPWVMLLVLANGMEMNSGTAKEAYMLIACMNLAGLLVLAFSRLTLRERILRLAVTGAAGALFLLISAPIWTTFLNALEGSYTAYNVPAAYQAHPALLLGLFDEIFYRPMQYEERVWNPSASFLVLLGVLYVAATWRRTPPDRTKLALTLAAIPPFALAFGVLPPSWIIRVPFLANVAHVDNTFSCALIVLFIVLAGFGWKVAWSRLGTSEGRGDLGVTGLLFVALVVPWIAINQVTHREPFGPNTVLPIKHDGLWGPPSLFVWTSLVILTIAAATLAFVTRSARRRGTWTPATTVLALTCLAVLLWRFGAHANTRFDDYVYNPPTRVDFHATSTAIEYVQSAGPDPFRVAGIENVLMPGWSMVYRLEGISGPDALVNPAFRELTSACGIERLWDWRLTVRPETLDALQRMYDMLNVRFFLATTPPATSETNFPLRHRSDLMVMESPSAWPRAFFTDRIAPAESADEFGRLIQAGDGRPFATAPARDVARLGLASELPQRTVVPARNYRLTPNTTTLEVEAPSRGILVLHEAWQPDNFVVTVNEEPAECVRINHAFKGVIIEQSGLHVVQFRFRPRHFGAALLACVAGLAGLGGLWMLLRRLPAAAP